MASSIRALAAVSFTIGPLVALACGDGAATTSATASSSSSSSTSSSSGAGGAGGQSTGPVVTIASGPIEGALVGATREFLGIPYAAPPVGPLRWKPPQAPAPWKETRKATMRGPECPQLSAIGAGYVASSSEDCLSINVWTPQKPASGALPVMVWIHGGGWVLGSGGEDGYDGQKLSEATGAIVMTFNYRLGPLGYLALAELSSEDAKHPSSGDYGLEDQRLALQWAKQNAAAFGGDPARITAFGESAGGGSVCHHLVSPASKGLFTRALLESGPCEAVTADAAAKAQGAELVQALGCKGADVLGCLRGKTAKDVIEALPLPKDLVFSPGAKWFPVVDGLNLPDLPDKLLAAGAFEAMPTLLGTNADEATLFFFLGNTTVADDAALQALGEKLAPGHGADIAMRYPSATFGTATKAAEAAVRDATFTCPTRRLARAVTKAGAPAFLYQFTYAPANALIPNLGAFHSSEIRYVFDQPQQLLPMPLTADEEKLASAMMGYWSRFAATQDPNGSGAFAWPAYDAQADQNIVLDMKLSKQSGLLKDACDFWDGVPLAAP